MDEHVNPPAQLILTVYEPTRRLRGWRSSWELVSRRNLGGVVLSDRVARGTVKRRPTDPYLQFVLGSETEVSMSMRLVMYDVKNRTGD